MFGQPGNGDLLLRGGFEGTVGNGFGNDTGNNESNSGTPAPGQSVSSTFDLSDFPSLGGGGTSSAGGDISLANALRQQHQLIAQQQLMQGGATGQGNNTGKQQSQSSNLYRLAMGSSMANALGTAGSNGTNFKIATEDFPALGAPLGRGAAPGNANSTLLGGIDGSQTVTSSTNSISFSGGRGTPSVSRSGGGVFGNESLDGLTNQLDSPSFLNNGGISTSGNQTNGGNMTIISQSQQRITSSSVTEPTTSVSNSSGGPALSGDFGLLGLLKVIRMTDADRNALALGSDLTSLGLNLNSSDSLYSTFASPWSENATNREPQYQLPMCYYMQPPALKTGHLSKFQLETLFYIFYALPSDVLQAYAAQELYAREWKFHVELKLWFKRASPADGVSNTSSGMQFIYFDINQWERRLFNGNMNQNITSGLLSEDDTRVKFSSS